MTSKDDVRDFWNEAACGEGLLLPSRVGRRLSLARRLWPRCLLRRVAKQFGLFLLIAGTKPI